MVYKVLVLLPTIIIYLVFLICKLTLEVVFYFLIWWLELTKQRGGATG